MKILFLATTYEYGGVSKVIKNILDDFDRKSFEVVFLVERLALRHRSIPKYVRLIKIDHANIDKILQLYANIRTPVPQGA